MIDASAVARETGMGGRINTDHADLLLRDLRRAAARGGDRADQEGDREDLRQARARRSCKRNFAAVDATLAHLHEVAGAGGASTATQARPPIVPAEAPDFVKRVTAVMLAGKGDLLPVSAFPVDGTWPIGTAQVGEAQHRARDPGLGPGDLHPVQQVRAGLPARGDPRQGLRRRRRCRAPRATFKSTRLQGPRVQGAARTRSRSRPRTAPAATSA